MDTSALFRQFVAFTAAVHQVKHELTKDVTPDTITPVQYSMLEYLALSQPLTLSQLSDCLHMSMPNASRELKKCMEKQLCEKYTAPDDRRKQYVQLSEAGEAMMNEVFARIEARFLQRIQGVSNEKLKDVTRALHVLHTNVFFTDQYDPS